ncbi:MULTISPECIES: DUF2225 domain-containing protein [Clostridium]|uniref:DUF2225 domain-containing protein n=1 Tax=Clostridium ragsdalei P11 TaxID=1353534 RepID=A0A1A6AP51_9CLOT|nr:MULTISPECIES: DUF2225 domain-containing protein [Clostridium]OBR91849.1 hypothetical protein CLRAG_28330 [Clostridium ragsdalei P11]QXE19569.1 hypothetical protein B5S50_12470 [Clostridium sp. 001]
MSKKNSLGLKSLNEDDGLSEEERQKLLLYNKKVVCPVCDNNFNARAIKKSSYRILKKDSDFFIRYSIINPYFYDVWVCDECGYSAMKSDFEHLSDYDANIIRQKISPKWKSKNYPEVYDIDLAITRYKLSLLNYYIINARSSKKAMNSLKIAWMYRLKEDEKKEMEFLNQALENLQSAYYNEPSPIYGMDKFTTMYLIGELMRRTGREEDSIIWFSEVTTSTIASQKIKNLARDQKDLIKNVIAKTEDNNAIDDSGDNKKHGLFSKFHK